MIANRLRGKWSDYFGVIFEKNVPSIPITRALFRTEYVSLNVCAAEHNYSYVSCHISREFEIVSSRFLKHVVKRNPFFWQRLEAIAIVLKSLSKKHEL